MTNIKLLSIVMFFMTFAVSANAQTITITQQLTFGTIAIDNLNDDVSLSIQNNGSCSANVNTFIIDSCTRGEFLITGGPASTVYSVTMPASVILTGSGPATFLMNNFRIRPNTLITDASGTDTFRIMADITSTLGDNFGDGTYNDTFNITVNF